MARALEPYADQRPKQGLRRLMSHLPVPEFPDNLALPIHGSGPLGPVEADLAGF